MKEKFYLDTNIIFGYFLKKVSELKGEVKSSKVAEFLIESKDKINYNVSILTKVEIVRKLKSEFLLDNTLIEKIWKSFILDVKCTEIEVNINVSELYKEILGIVSLIPIRRRVTNLEHLIIANKKDLIFVTGDEEVLEKCKEFYSRIWSYKDLRRFYSNLNIW
jgi:hypothetical protein